MPSLTSCRCPLRLMRRCFLGKWTILKMNKFKFISTIQINTCETKTFFPTSWSAYYTQELSINFLSSFVTVWLNVCFYLWSKLIDIALQLIWITSVLWRYEEIFTWRCNCLWFCFFYFELNSATYSLHSSTNFNLYFLKIVHIFIIKGFQTIVFIFIVISTTFRPVCPPAFFRCLSNSGTFTELRTTSFIESTGVACSDSVSHNRVQASKKTIIWRWQVQSSLQASSNTGILNIYTRLSCISH